MINRPSAIRKLAFENRLSCHNNSPVFTSIAVKNAGPRWSCRGVDHIADTNGVLLWTACALCQSSFTRVLAAAPLKRNTRPPMPYARRREEQVVRPPDRRADVEVAIPLRRYRGGTHKNAPLFGSAPMTSFVCIENATNLLP